jgi:DNA-binding beta-propeller fold protein YncE
MRLRVAAVLLGSALVVSSCRLGGNHPETPLAPAGPVRVQADTVYEYRAFTLAPDGGAIGFQFEWGDGGAGSLTDYVYKGGPGRDSHAWTEPGTYEVRVRAIDSADLSRSSDWSNPLLVEVAGPDFPWRLVDSIDPVPVQSLDVLKISPDGRFLYLGNWEGPASFAAIRTEDDSVVAYIQLEYASWCNDMDIEVSSDGQRVYASGYDLDKVAVIRTSDFTIVDSFVEGFSDGTMAISPGGEYLCLPCCFSVPDSCGVFVVRTSDMSVADTIWWPECDWETPCRLTVSPSGAFLYIATECHRYLSAIRLRDGCRTSRVEGCGYGIAVHPVTGDVYVGQESGGLGVLNADCTVELHRVDGVSAYQLAVTPDGRYYCGFTRSGLLAVLRARDNVVVGSVPASPYGDRIVFSPDGGRMYVASWPTIYIYER